MSHTYEEVFVEMCFNTIMWIFHRIRQFALAKLHLLVRNVESSVKVYQPCTCNARPTIFKFVKPIPLPIVDVVVERLIPTEWIMISTSFTVCLFAVSDEMHRKALHQCHVIY